MRKKLISTYLALMTAALAALAQEPADSLLPRKIEIRDTVTAAFLDTVNVTQALSLNDYSMIGVNYGFGQAKTTFNPPKTQGSLTIPSYYGVTFTKYGKFFGYMPYFGIQLGLFKGTDGYSFKSNDEGEYNVTVDGATKVVYDFVEVPLVVQFHIDSQNFKILLDGGMYAGYRYKIHREGNFRYPDLMDDFTDYEYKWDYGFKVAAGVGLVLSPFELHFKLNMRYGLGDLYRPDYASKEYYRFATPFDLILTVGVHYQLSRRSGRTKSQIKEQARRNAEENWKQKLQTSFTNKISNYQNKAINSLKEELNIFDNNIKQHLEELSKEFDITWSQKFENEMTQFEQIINGINENKETKDLDDDFFLFKDDNINNNENDDIEEENLRSKPIDLKNIEVQPKVILRELNQTNSLINLILQCLSNIDKFVSYYLNPKNEEKILMKSKQNPNIPYLGPSLLKLLDNLWKGSKEVYSPNDIHEVLKQLMTNNYNSSDPGDLVSFILNQLNKELNSMEEEDKNDNLKVQYQKKEEYLQKFMTLRQKISNEILNNFYSILIRKKRCKKCMKHSYFFHNNPVINIYLESNNQIKLEENLKSFLIESEKKIINGKCLFCKINQEISVNQDIYATYSIIIFNLKRKNNSNASFVYPEEFDGRWVINYAYDLPNYQLISIIKKITDIKNKTYIFAAYIKSFIDNHWYKYTKEKIEIVKDKKEIFDKFNACLLIYHEIKS